MFGPALYVHRLSEPFYFLRDLHQRGASSWTWCMEPCLFDRRGSLLAYDAAISTALATARASHERVTEEEVREWLARAFARRRLAVHKRSKFEVVQDTSPIKPALASTQAK